MDKKNTDSLLEKIEILDFECEADLTKYVDSQLFDSNITIASGTFRRRERTDTIEMDLMVRGETKIYYNDNVYTSACDFPQGLKDMISKRIRPFGPNEAPFSDEDDEEVYIELGNWFEYIYTINGKWSDGVMFGGDLSECTPDDIMQEMLDLSDKLLPDPPDTDELPFPEASLTWESKADREKIKATVSKGWQSKIVRIISSPNGDGVVCSIGKTDDEWFYFGGLTAEGYDDPGKYIEDIGEEEIISEITDTLQEFFESGEEFGEEAAYCLNMIELYAK